MNQSILPHPDKSYPPPAAQNAYLYRSTVTIGDTNCTGNMYFLNFFKLQGIVRELWIKDCVENGLVDLTNGLRLITRDANNHFIKDFTLYEEVHIQLQFTRIERAHAQVRFRFYHADTGELHSEGFQTVVFANSSKRIVRIPPNWHQAMMTWSDLETGASAAPGGQSVEN